MLAEFAVLAELAELSPHSSRWSRDEWGTPGQTRQGRGAAREEAVLVLDTLDGRYAADALCALAAEYRSWPKGAKGERKG